VITNAYVGPLSVRTSTINLVELVDGRECSIWENFTGVRKEMCGDEDIEDVGDGGPGTEGDTDNREKTVCTVQ
jgi:hypothetical protein